MNLVAVDIGGTHARFAVCTVSATGEITLGDPVTLETREHASFQTAWEHFARRHGSALPRAISFSVAAPVEKEFIRLTNNPWVIARADLGQQLGVDQVTVINDFAAVSHAVGRCTSSHYIHLTGPEEPLPAEGTISVVGPGTGLGVGHLYRDGRGGYRVQATEGGHLDYAPLDAIEDAILARLRQRYRRVSTERVVSGPGIVDIYETLAALEHRSIEPIDDRTIWQRGTSGEDSLAAAAIDRFCLSLGSVAGDLALAQGASGVVIAGGLGLRIKDTLLKSGFAMRFSAKGRFEAKMAAMPVKLITHPQPGLFGAAAAFVSEHGLPG